MKRVILIIILLFIVSCAQQNIQTEQDIDEIFDDSNQIMEVQEVTYSLFEWGIEPVSNKVKEGEIKFIINNDGTDFHTFKIEGNGIDKEVGVLKGDTEILELNLRKGEYSIYCSVPGHSYKGMEANLIVE